MSYNVIPTPDFRRMFKKLAKKYPSLKSDLQSLIEILAENPATGTNLGHNLYKIRLAISSKGKGKSGGARVITFWPRMNLRYTWCTSTIKASLIT